MFKLIKEFWADESGVSGVVVAAALVIISSLLSYYFYSGLKPGVQSVANNIAKVLQQQ